MTFFIGACTLFEIENKDKFMYYIINKNPAKRRSALNLHLCIDYYIQNHLNTHHNTSRNTQLYTGLYWVGVRWAVTKC